MIPMKFKLDENVPTQFAGILREKGDHQVDTVDTEHIRGGTDHSLARKCKMEERVLITADTDFSKSLLHPLKNLYGIVVLRSDFPSKRVMLSMFKRFVEMNKLEDLPGKVVIVDNDQVTIRDE